MAGEETASGTEFIGSHQKAKNGYGQNGYQGPSSDLPGKNTRMNRDYGLKADPSLGGVTSKPGETGNWQTRAVSKEAYPTTFGMKSPGEPSKIPATTNHRTSKQAAPGSFQR